METNYTKTKPYPEKSTETKPWVSRWFATRVLSRNVITLGMNFPLEAQHGIYMVCRLLPGISELLVSLFWIKSSVGARVYHACFVCWRDRRWITVDLAQYNSWDSVIPPDQHVPWFQSHGSREDLKTYVVCLVPPQCKQSRFNKQQRQRMSYMGRSDFFLELHLSDCCKKNFIGRPPSKRLVFWLLSLEMSAAHFDLPFLANFNTSLL